MIPFPSRDDGWSLVKKVDGGGEGLVPTSYIGKEEDVLTSNARSYLSL